MGYKTRVFWDLFLSLTFSRSLVFQVDWCTQGWIQRWKHLLAHLRPLCFLWLSRLLNVRPLTSLLRLLASENICLHRFDRKMRSSSRSSSRSLSFLSYLIQSKVSTKIITSDFQLHNPYIATPLSIASYRMATSPSDQNNTNVLSWLERLQTSVHDVGKSGSPRAFLDIRDPAGEDSDGDSEGKRTLAQGDVGTQFKTEQTGNEEPLGDLDGEDSQSALPDATVPLGLIANLSLGNTKKAGKKKDTGKDAAGLLEEDLNDDNIGVANATYFMPGNEFVVDSCLLVNFIQHFVVFQDRLRIWGSEQL